MAEMVLDRPATVAPAGFGAPVAAPDGVVVLPVAARCGRPVGVYAIGSGRVRFRPVLDPRLLAWSGVAVTGFVAAAVAVAAATRRPPAIGAVTMGHGGWISVKGARLPALRPQPPRPWWARILSAHRLTL
jgi:hypothetical protein